MKSIGMWMSLFKTLHHWNVVCIIWTCWLYSGHKLLRWAQGKPRSWCMRQQSALLQILTWTTELCCITYCSEQWSCWGIARMWVNVSSSINRHMHHERMTFISFSLWHLLQNTQKCSLYGKMKWHPEWQAWHYVL